MKTVVLQRAWSDARATLGMLSVLGETHDPIFTLENPFRAEVRDSRIPAGEYLCEPYSGSKHKDVYIVRDVPGRTAILLHTGNFEKDTDGCILLGNGAAMSARDPMVTGSRAAFDKFKALIGREEFKLLILERLHA